jgi:hypothetical protein
MPSPYGATDVLRPENSGWLGFKINPSKTFYTLFSMTTSFYNLNIPVGGEKSSERRA